MCAHVLIQWYENGCEQPNAASELSHSVVLVLLQHTEHTDNVGLLHGQCHMHVFNASNKTNALRVHNKWYNRVRVYIRYVDRCRGERQSERTVKCNIIMCLRGWHSYTHICFHSNICCCPWHEPVCSVCSPCVFRVYVLFAKHRHLQICCCRYKPNTINLCSVADAFLFFVQFCVATKYVWRVHHQSGGPKMLCHQTGYFSNATRHNTQPFGTNLYPILNMVNILAARPTVALMFDDIVYRSEDILLNMW